MGVLVLSMLLPMSMERGLLMPSPRLMPTTPMPMELMVLAMAMVDMPMVATPMPMVPTMERGRLMPTMPLTDMVSPMLATAMPVLPMVMVPTPTPMVLMPTASKMCNQSQIRVAHQVQTEAQKQTKSRSDLTFNAINSFVI